ncbi:MAG: hypothetical protein LBD03_10140 [Methanobrevibacter sp.]|jgi:hypothetical protein|nr:hypothetical protein [Candidatus Methanovirga procula]
MADFLKNKTDEEIRKIAKVYNIGEEWSIDFCKAVINWYLHGKPTKNFLISLDIVDIIDRYENGESIFKIAKKYNVTHKTIERRIKKK